MSATTDAKPTDGRHTATLSIPFASKEHATIAKRVISVDRELNQHLVERQLEVGDGGELRVTYRAETVRLLRLATNGFIDNLDLVIRTIHEFAPPTEAKKAGEVA